MYVFARAREIHQYHMYVIWRCMLAGSRKLISSVSMAAAAKYRRHREAGVKSRLRWRDIRARMAMSF